MAGVVIRLSPRAFGETSALGDIVSAGTAALDKRVAETAVAASIGGMEGVVIRLSPRAFGETAASGDIVSAGAAALDKRVAETAAAANIGGMEFFFGIPGTIGGALRMNAGANGGETKDVLVEATGIGRDGTRHIFGNAEMKFVYRNSGVDPSIIFTSARFRGRLAAPEAIRARMNEVQNHRETAQFGGPKINQVRLQRTQATARCPLWEEIRHECGR